MRETILVTGGAGFIGSHVSKYLQQYGYQVIVLDDLSGGSKENLPSGVVFVEGNILDRSLIEELFVSYRFSYIFHLAAYAAEVLSHHIKHFNYQNNLIGSINLINAAVNYQAKCFVFTSSIGVYGRAPSPLTELMRPEPIDSYGIAKYAVELELAATHEMFGLDYIIFRPHNVYGEGQNIGDRYRNVVGIFMNQIMQGQPMTIFGDGEQTRAFSYIDDVAPVIARSIEIPAAYNQIFNVGADTPTSVRHLALVVAQAMGVESQIIYEPFRHEAAHPHCSHEKVNQIFGLTDLVGLQEGITRMATWAKRIGIRKSSNFEEIEIPVKMPPSWQSEIVG